MNELVLKAPAKINLCLTVIGKRPDGYHEVSMLMQMVGLYDEVRLSITDSGIEVACDARTVPEGEGNIAHRAASAVLERSGRRAGLRISIRKRIPVAAGLGGGSSDAAAVLNGANRLLQAGLTVSELEAAGAGLGMDVPFFLHGPLALAIGRGEEIIPLPPLPNFWVLLVNPGFETSTAWVYNNLNLKLTKKMECNKIPRLTVGKIAESLHNDLESVTADAHPVIREIELALLASGALGARMSGSGPTVFGIFETEAACRNAEERLAPRGWRCFPVPALTEPPFTA